MTVKFKARGYAHEIYEVIANENEILTKEAVIEEVKKIAGFIFGCDIQINNKFATVKVYTD